MSSLKSKQNGCDIQSRSCSSDSQSAGFETGSSVPREHHEAAPSMIWNSASYIDRYFDRYIDGIFESLDDVQGDAKLERALEKLFDFPLSFFYSSKAARRMMAHVLAVHLYREIDDVDDEELSTWHVARMVLKKAFGVYMPNFESSDNESPPPRIKCLSNPLRSEIVYIVTSPLALTKPRQFFTSVLAVSKLFEYLTGFNTTHWGLKIGGHFYDLKRSGSWPNAQTTVEVAQAITRTERETLSTEILGMTHFDYYSREDIAQHLIEHYPYYSSWFDNCQAYAVNILATTLLCPSCGCGPEIQELSRPSNAYFSLFTVSLLRRKLFVTTVYASLFAYAVKAFQSDRFFSAALARLLIACFVCYISVHSRHVLRQPSKKLIASMFANNMSSAWHIFDYTPLLFMSSQLPFQDDCFRCRSIARRKKYLAKNCRQMSGYKIPRHHTKFTPVSWIFWKGVLSSLTWSAPTGFVVALDWVFYLPLRALIPVLCSVQLAIFFLIRNLHGSFYSAGYDNFVPTPWAYPVLVTTLIYTVRFWLDDLDFSYDPLIKAHNALSESILGPQDGTLWNIMRTWNWIISAILYSLIFGWICYELLEDMKNTDIERNRIIGDQTMFGNPKMSWRRQLKRAPTL